MDFSGKGLFVIRWLKAFAVAQVALYFSLVFFNKVTDFNADLVFVQHVLQMDTTFLSPNIMWRAINNPLIHKIAYFLIIFLDLLAAVVSWIGAIKLFMNCRSKEAFSQSKNIANLGLCIGIFLYFIGFMAIGGEWFAMWQSSGWNGVDAAARFIMIMFFTLLFLNLREE